MKAYESKVKSEKSPIYFVVVSLDYYILIYNLVWIYQYFHYFVSTTVIINLQYKNAGISSALISI